MLLNSQLSIMLSYIARKTMFSYSAIGPHEIVFRKEEQFFVFRNRDV